jgi:Fur family zinc uptake transcriptional regulator
MTNVNETVDYAEQQCKNRGSRLTDKRKLVLSGLLRSEKPLSAYELIEFCKVELGETLPAMTIYRVLDFLEREQLVHKLNLHNKYVACEHITCDHSHSVSQFLICCRCQKVEEVIISKSMVKELQENVESAGFFLENPQIEINCICEECR